MSLCCVVCIVCVGLGGGVRWWVAVVFMLKSRERGGSVCEGGGGGRLGGRGRRRRRMGMGRKGRIVVVGGRTILFLDIEKVGNVLLSFGATFKYSNVISIA